MSSTVDVPDVSKLIGDFGPWQKRIYITFIFACLISQWQNLCVTFLAPTFLIDFWCVSHIAPNESSYWNTSSEWKPVVFDKFKNHTNNVEKCNVVSDQNISSACTAWNYSTANNIRTIVSEWDLVCEREWLISFSKAIYMIGYLISTITLGQLADWFGRYPIIAISYTIMTVSALLLPCSSSYTMFAMLRFFLGFGRTGVTTTGFVLLMELVSPKWRTDLGVGVHIGWSIGYIILPGIAWFIRDWVYLQLALSLPVLLLACIYWVFPESPRWLITQEKFTKFNTLVENAAKRNNFTIVQKNLNLQMENWKEKNKIASEDGQTQKKTIVNVVKTPMLRLRMLSVFFIWIVNSFVYYGLSFNTNDLAGNPYLNFFLSGLVEFPGVFIAVYSLRKFGRKHILVAGHIAVGICCFAVAFVPNDMKWLTTTFAMMGKLFISATYSVIILYTTEFFPTVVRTSMFGICTALARIGPILAPFGHDLAKVTHTAVPNLLNGVVAVIAGILVLTLRETKDVRIPDTLEQTKNQK